MHYSKTSIATNPIWVKCNGHYNRAIKSAYFQKEISVKITAASPVKPPDPPPKASSNKPSSPKPSTSRKRAARKSFEEKSERAQMKETAKIRDIYPHGAIVMAAGQSLRISGDHDSAAVLKEIVQDATASKKARKSLKLENPCEFTLANSGDHSVEITRYSLSYLCGLKNFL